jgi:hypothetical protein
VDTSCLTGDFCFAKLPAFIPAGGTWRRKGSSDHPLLLPSSVAKLIQETVSPKQTQPTQKLDGHNHKSSKNVNSRDTLGNSIQRE